MTDLILNNLFFAEQIAASQFKKTPRRIQYDELKSAAYLGLTVAASRYNGTVPFEAFARKRILGEIKDYLRKYYWRNRETTYLDECFI